MKLARISAVIVSTLAIIAGMFFGISALASSGSGGQFTVTFGNGDTIPIGVSWSAQSTPPTNKLSVHTVTFGASGPSQFKVTLTPGTVTTPTSTSTSTSTSSSSTTSSTTTSTTTMSSKFVSGAWDLGWDPVGAAAPFGALSQDDLFALQTTNGSALDTSLLSQVNVSSWVAAVHSAHDLAIISLGGSSNQNWQYACSSANQAAFVNNVVNYVVNNGLDGLDIDMEDDQITATPAPVPLWTGCAQALISALHSAKTAAGKMPIVSEDIITNWEGPWVQPYEVQVDQFNLMTYGDTCSSSTNCPSFASDILDTAQQLCPNGGSCIASVESRFTLGLDMSDSPSTESSCGYAAAYARSHGYLGAFDWELEADKALGNFPCQTAIEANG